MWRRTYLRHLAGGLAGLAGGCSALEDDSPSTTPGTPSTSTPSETPTPTDSPPSEETTSQEPQSFAADANWPQFQYDVANTGLHPTTSGPTNAVTQRWQFNPEKEASQPAVVDGTVYFGTGAEEVVALDEGDGTEVWRAPVTGPVTASPAVADGSVYVATQRHHVYAFAADTGKNQWRVRTDTSRNEYEDGIAVSEGTVYVEGFALEATTGTTQWESGRQGYVPAVDDASVYTADGAEVHALDRADGSERWTYTAPRTTNQDIEMAGRPTVAHGRVYVGLYASNPPDVDAGTGRAYALSASDGTKHWRVDTEDPVAGTAVAGETVYITTADAGHAYQGAVWALDAPTGDKHWRVELDERPAESPAIADDVLYVEAHTLGESEVDSTIIALDLEAGGELWRVTLDGDTPDTIVANETVYNGDTAVTALW